MSILLSINKPHSTNLLNETKTIEWRKLELPKGTCYLYETKNKGGCGKVVGSVYIYKSTFYANISDIPDEVIQQGMVSREFLKEYAKNQGLFANFVKGANPFLAPLNIQEFQKECPYPNAAHCILCKFGVKRTYEYESGEEYTKWDCSNLVNRAPQFFIYVTPQFLHPEGR